MKDETRRKLALLSTITFSTEAVIQEKHARDLYLQAALNARAILMVPPVEIGVSWDDDTGKAMSTAHKALTILVKSLGATV